MNKENKEIRYAFLSEVLDYAKPLFQHNLTFARIIDDLIVPYENNESFFIDGVPLKRDKIKKLKIIRQDEDFEYLFNYLHDRLRSSDIKEMKILGDQYHTRLEAIMRQNGEDVTSQMINAYNIAIKPNFKKYFSNKSELIENTMKIFLEAIKLLGSNQ